MPMLWLAVLVLLLPYLAWRGWHAATGTEMVLRAALASWLPRGMIVTLVLSVLYWTWR